MSLKEVKMRIIATQKTKQITKAMGMVSSSKLRKAEVKHTGYQEFVKSLNEIVVNILVNIENLEDHVLLERRETKKTDYLVITSDRGLSGSYNSGLFKDLEEYLKKNHKSKDEYVINAVGKIGFHYFQKHECFTQKELIFDRDDVIFSEIGSLAEKIIQAYINHEIDRLVIVYKHFVNSLVQETVFKPVLPIRNITGKNYHLEYDFESGLTETLDLVLSMYVENILYNYILDAKKSEHACRMNAMQNATKNAEEITEKLKLMYNRSRQETITNELIDIVGGAQALRKE